MATKLPPVFWLTGLSGSGKTTLALELCARLRARGLTVSHIDGDVLREQFGESGFRRIDRLRNMRRAARLASKAQQNGHTVVVSLISPYRKLRERFRSTLAPFFEIYLSTPLRVCEARDPKGLYRRARAGQVHQLTGVSDPYETPESPHCVLDTSRIGLRASCERLMGLFEKEGLI